MQATLAGLGMPTRVGSGVDGASLLEGGAVMVHPHSKPATPMAKSGCMPQDLCFMGWSVQSMRPWVKC